MSTVAHEHDHHHAPTGLKRWIFSTNHKDIGTLYLIFSLMMFFIGGAMAMIIRAELFQPGLQFVDPQFYNSMVTEIGRAHVRTPVTEKSRMPSSA